MENPLTPDDVEALVDDYHLQLGPFTRDVVLDLIQQHEITTGQRATELKITRRHMRELQSWQVDMFSSAPQDFFGQVISLYGVRVTVHDGPLTIL